jgi:hypothetical protein
MSNDSHDSLFQEAMDAARAGNRDLAREKLEKLLEIDEENVNAWLLLARLSDLPEEKRICLTTVLQLDPENARARSMLDKLEARLAERAQPDIIPGVSRRTAMIIGGGVGGVLLIGLIVVVAVITSNNNAEAERERELIALGVTQTQAILQQTQGALDATETAFVLTETQFARVSPTPSQTATSGGPTLPPTVTPTAAPTDIPTLPPPPLDSPLPGTIIGWSGEDLARSGLLDLVRFPMTEGAVSELIIEEEQGRFVTSADGVRYVFLRDRGSFDPEITEIDTSLEPIPLQNLALLWVADTFIDEPDMVRMSLDGRFITFTGETVVSGTREVFVFELPQVVEDTDEQSTAEDGGSAQLLQVTNDDAEYSFPMISPDSRFVVAVREVIEGDNPGVDLVVINLESRLQTALTVNGAEVVETMPYWSPDGRSIIYAYAADDDDDTLRDLAVVAADGSGTGFNLLETPDTDEIFPIYSPDGRYIAFSSDRFDHYDLYVYDTQSQSIFQLTNDEAEDYAGGWLEN